MGKKTIEVIIRGGTSEDKGHIALGILQQLSDTELRKIAQELFDTKPKSFQTLCGACHGVLYREAGISRY